MATLCWRKGVVAIGIRQPGPGNDAMLMATIRMMYSVNTGMGNSIRRRPKICINLWAAPLEVPVSYMQFFSLKNLMAPGCNGAEPTFLHATSGR